MKINETWLVQYKNYDYDSYTGIVTIIRYIEEESLYECRLDYPKCSNQLTAQFERGDFLVKVTVNI